MLRKMWSYWKEPAKKNSKVVLVVGEPGAGKSSLINLIVGEDVANTSASVQKGIFETDDYKYGHFVMVDTAGYTEETEENPEQGFKNLARLAKKVLTDGISLIVYVMKKGGVTTTSKKHYDYFVNTVCKNKVPVLLVVTHCELDDDVQEWYRKQVDAFTTLEMNFTDFVCGSTIDLTDSTIERKQMHVLRQEREDTRDKVLQRMGGWALEKAWKPEKSNEWIARVFVGASVFGLIFTVSVMPTLVPILGAGVALLKKK